MNEARRLMADQKIREWTKNRLGAAAHPDHPELQGPASARADDRVDLREISTIEMRRFLNRQFRAMRIRQDAELDALDRAHKLETRRILQHKQSFFGRTIGALAALPGLRSALERHRIPDLAEREQAFRAQRIAMKNRHDQQDQPFAAEYRALKRRESQHHEILLKAELEHDLNAEQAAHDHHRNRSLGYGYHRGYGRDDDD